MHHVLRVGCVLTVLAAIAVSSPAAADEQPSWAVAYGAEFWRTTTGFGDAVDRVNHAIRVDAPILEPDVDAATYRAVFAERGLRFYPTAPQLSGPADSGELSIRTVGSSSRSFAFVGNTAQALIDPELGLVEHFEARGQGVSLTWILRRRPAGDRAFAIEAEIGAAEYRGRTEDGLHFADASGTARVRIGPATPVDSQGRRWSLETRFESGRLIVDVPREVMEDAVFPLAIDPVIGPEYGMDDPVEGPGGSFGFYTDIVFDGTNYLVVWSRYSSSAFWEVMGTRVSGADATVLDPDGIVIWDQPGIVSVMSGYPVASDGSVFTVVLRLTQMTDYERLAAFRIDAGGTLLDPAGITIVEHDSALVFNSPAIASNGDNFLIAWSDEIDISSDDIKGARLDGATGTVLAPGVFSVCADLEDQYYPAVASDGTDYLVAWVDDRNETVSDYDIYATRVEGNSGTVLDGDGFVVCEAIDYQYDPSVASNGTHYLVAWEDERDEAVNERDVYAARIEGASGTVVDPGGFVVAAGTAEESGAGVASDGADFFVVWGETLDSFYGDILGTRILAADATLLDDPPIELVGTSYIGATPSGIDSNGTEYLVAGSVLFYYQGIVVQRVSAADGSVLDPDGIHLITTINAQYGPAVACIGSSCLLAWMDTRNFETGGYDIYGARIDVAGTAINVLDPSGIAISQGPEWDYYPRVATDGTDYLVAWSGHTEVFSFDEMDGDIFGARVQASDGAVLDTDPIVICDVAGRQIYPDVASNGTNYLVAWIDYRDSTDSLEVEEVYATLVTSGGSVVAPDGDYVSLSSNSFSLPGMVSVASNGQHYLIAWQDNRNEGTTDEDIYAARVDGTDGTVIDVDGLPVSQYEDEQRYPAVVGNGSDYLVAWVDNREMEEGYNAIFSTMVDGTTAVVDDPDGKPVPGAIDPGYTFDAAFNGSTFLVAWYEASEDLWINDYAIHGALLHGPDGTAVEPGEFEIVPDDQFQYVQAVGAVGDDYVVAYSVIEQSSYRTKARIIQLDTCVIDSETYTEGELNPDNLCEECIPTLATDAWSVRDCSYLADQCNLGGCLTFMGCLQVPVDNGTVCDDELHCTEGDECTDGECAGTELDCSYLDEQCVDGVCSEFYEGCYGDYLPWGTECDDGDPDTYDDICHSGGECYGTSDTDTDSDTDIDTDTDTDGDSDQADPDDDGARRDSSCGCLVTGSAETQTGSLIGLVYELTTLL
jgi:hypothetical protein